MSGVQRRTPDVSPTCALRVGLIADTHNLLRNQALTALAGCDHIFHAGDICRPEVLLRLAEQAPLTAVRGNNDKGEWADALAPSEWLQLGGITLHVLHDRADLDIDPVAAGVDVVVTGHSHRPLIERRDGVLWVNPGSAGPRRFRLPVTLTELRIEAGKVDARLIELDPDRA